MALRLQRSHIVRASAGLKLAASKTLTLMNNALCSARFLFADNSVSIGQAILLGLMQEGMLSRVFFSTRRLRVVEKAFLSK